MTDQPQVSIITPCLNRADRVGAALESVRAQTYKGPIEHIVIDGNSTDGSLEVLKSYDVKVFSEPDRNVYDALNKGLARASGEIVGLLNSDDTYRPDAISKAVAALEAAPEASMACGGADIIDDDERILVRHDSVNTRSLAVHDILFGVPSINARFFRRAIFDRVGRFDIRYALAADREFLLRAALAHEIAVPVSGIAYSYRLHPGSLTIGGRNARARIADDHMRLAEDWMRRPSVPSNAVREFQRFHAQAVLMGALCAVRRRDPSTLRACIKRGYGLNRWWPVEIPPLFATWIGRRLFSA